MELREKAIEYYHDIYPESERPIKQCRRWLMADYLCQIEGTILNVGVASYNYRYCEIVKDPSKYYTIDICPERSKKGGNHIHPENNFVGDLKSHYEKYDHICLFGIHGFEGYEIHNNEVYMDLIHCDENLMHPWSTLCWGPNNEINIENFDGETVEFKSLANDFINKEPPLKNYTQIYKDFSTRKGPNMLWWGYKDYESYITKNTK